ncbi:hypothetical protein Pla52o_12790 [Novipirellula galeiformis]|uniref:Uncharacterized protein n=1 Tax=Novipirellula galeiformis TaxID=2528004 RepID=A0A5C6CKN6_9BACT|nr:hypothetical protein Pla52o_12790 [Novipirellula galeiformis]
MVNRKEVRNHSEFLASTSLRFSGGTVPCSRSSREWDLADTFTLPDAWRTKPRVVHFLNETLSTNLLKIRAFPDAVDAITDYGAPTAVPISLFLCLPKSLPVRLRKLMQNQRHLPQIVTAWLALLALGTMVVAPTVASASCRACEACGASQGGTSDVQSCCATDVAGQMDHVHCIATTDGLIDRCPCETCWGPIESHHPVPVPSGNPISLAVDAAEPSLNDPWSGTTFSTRVVAPTLFLPAQAQCARLCRWRK